MVCDLKNVSIVGVVGLGVMGRNLALNMVEKGFGVIAYDPWARAREKFINSLSSDEAELVVVADSYKAMVEAVEVPRTVLVMVKAGELVDDVICALTPYLLAGDILIDGGNSHYVDTIRRETQLKKQGMYFLGLGVSGGEKGARHGSSLMAGGDPTAYEIARPVLEAIAARFDNIPCCALLGPNGAGHFVKMIHNGIEYGVMQLITEIYLLLRDVVGLNYESMANVFHKWDQTELASYLVEITSNILKKIDEETGAPLLEMILDKAGQKGTGRWSSEAALATHIPSPTITEAVFARAMASLKEERVAASGILVGPMTSPTVSQSEEFIDALRQALLMATIITYAQGLAVIQAASRENSWCIELGQVASIWRAGCVIRASLLGDVMRAYQDDQPQNLMLAKTISKTLETAQGGLRLAISKAVDAGIPVPGLSSALAYFDGYRSAKSGANLIQAQRDSFGAHTYERIDQPGIFHSQW